LRDAAGPIRTKATEGCLKFEVRRLFLQNVVIVVGAKADENAGSASLELHRSDARIFGGPPCGFEQEALLWIKSDCLSRRDAEKVGIEILKVLDEATLRRNQAAEFARLVVVWPIRRDIANRIAPAAKQLPELDWGIGSG
jgi:hypothetical protein